MNAIRYNARMKVFKLCIFILFFVPEAIAQNLVSDSSFEHNKSFLILEAVPLDRKARVILNNTGN